MRHHHVNTPILRAGAALAAAGPGLRRRFLVLCVALGIAFAVALAAALPAMAQQVGNPDAINSALDQAVKWISGIVVSVGVLGLIASSIVWIASGTNQKRREGAVSWMFGCCFAIFIAFAAPSIVSLLQGWAGKGGGT